MQCPWKADPGAFQAAACVLGLRASGLVQEPQGWRLGFPQPSGSPGGSPAGFHTQAFGNLSSQGRSPGLASPTRDVDPPLLGVTFSAGLSLPWGQHARGVASDWTTSLRLLPVSIWPLPYILGCGTSVLLSSGHPSSEIVVSYAVVVLVCLWEEVSSGFSSSLSWSGILKELKLFSSTCWFPTSVNILKNGCHTSKPYPF